MTLDSNKCIIDGFGGYQHPYNYCIKPPDEMVTMEKSTGLNLNNTARTIGGIFNYIEYLTINGDKGTAQECQDSSGTGLIGNRYVLKTNITCQPVINGIISGDEQPLHKYINNVSDGASFLSGNRPIPSATGVIPSTFSSASKMGDNIYGLLTSFTGNTKPYCVAAELKCHIIDGNDNANSYKGFSPSVYFSLDDIKKLPADFFKDNSKPDTTPPRASFQNIDSQNVDSQNIGQNIVNQNIDKLQNLSDIDTLLNSLNFEDELLIKMYYVGFSILLIIIIFKLLYKK